MSLKIRHTEDSALEVGIDEAGRGSFWGPLYAAAVIWPTEITEELQTITPMIRDSKKLSEKKRMYLEGAIKDLAIDWGIGRVEPSEIDTLGMTKANQLAFTRALESLNVVEPERLLIDGCISIYDPPWSMIQQVVEPEADSIYVSVAAASILAKTARDTWIHEYCAINTNISDQYDILNSKGYGTKKHRDGILANGPHVLHRKLFLRKLYQS
jgi:ribonuclease HII